MNPVPLFLIIVSLPLLLGGCGEKTIYEIAPQYPREPINRIWNLVAGTKLEAELISFTDKEVILKPKQGGTTKLSLNKLAEYDRYFVKGLEKPIIPEGGIKFHRLSMSSGKKLEALPYHFKDGKSFSGYAYRMYVDHDAKDSDGFGLHPHDKGYFSDEVWEIITFKNGLPDGPIKGFYHKNENKQKQYEWNQSLKDNDLVMNDGLYIKWDESGKEITVSSIKNDTLEGLEVTWNKNGQKESERNYNNGDVVSQKYWNSKGEEVDSLKEAKAE